MFTLINFTHFPALNQLRNKMQAQLTKNFTSVASLSLLDEEFIRKLGQEGIDVVLDDIVIAADKTLRYKNKHVLLYIRDVKKYQDQFHLPRFHIAYCQKLEEMQASGKWTRYVIANREDGYFQINIIAGNYVDAKTEPLSVCQFCLDTLNWEDFSMHASARQVKQQIVRNFSIAAFFNYYAAVSTRES